MNELGKLCRIVTKGIGKRELELLLLDRLSLLLLGWSQPPPYWRLLLLLPDRISHLARDLAIWGAKIRTANQLK